jgi:hypothetical protein
MLRLVEKASKLDKNIEIYSLSLYILGLVVKSIVARGNYMFRKVYNLFIWIYQTSHLDLAALYL